MGVNKSIVMKTYRTTSVRYYNIIMIVYRVRMASTTTRAAARENAGAARVEVTTWQPAPRLSMTAVGGYSPRERSAGSAS